ncbi:hypothetical protein FJT64_026662 [Amphibalanus amphitrite]|uniref:Uncharacterized protein n=1 Tax=Amphibalanus amphitrite TaxID=1232801 RepID=A0A6A4WFY5_AMPAM|nr:hypothetical protein FJT64_026662 [Amphibalanus amphitrite]
MLENPSKPRKGVPKPPPGWDGSAAGGDGAAGAEPLSEEGAAALTNLAKARAAVIVGSVFGVLSLLVLAWYGVRRVTDSWQHRHYRKMDFLVDGMYNM